MRYPGDRLRGRLLSAEPEYEGGEFQALDHAPVGRRQKGALLVFPSFLQYRVTPVTTGYRQCLVAWLVGPKFR